jgi:hypothetical protein
MTIASTEIQFDRFSKISDAGASVAFLDTAHTFIGWKAILDKPGAWIQYNSVDFGKKKLKSVRVRALSFTGGTLEIRLDKADGPLLSEVKIPGDKDWNTVNTRVQKFQKGIHNLVVVLKGSNQVEIDWIRFSN